MKSQATCKGENPKPYSTWACTNTTNLECFRKYFVSDVLIIKYSNVESCAGEVVKIRAFDKLLSDAMHHGPHRLLKFMLL